MCRAAWLNQALLGKQVGRNTHFNHPRCAGKGPRCWGNWGCSSWIQGSLPDRAGQGLWDQARNWGIVIWTSRCASFSFIPLSVPDLFGLWVASGWVVNPKLHYRLHCFINHSKSHPCHQCSKMGVTEGRKKKTNYKNSCASEMEHAAFYKFINKAQHELSDPWFFLLLFFFAFIWVDAPTSDLFWFWGDPFISS